MIRPNHQARALLVSLVILAMGPAWVAADEPNIFITPISSGEAGLGESVVELMITPAEEFIRRIHEQTTDRKRALWLLEWLGYSCYYELAKKHQENPASYNESLSKAKVVLNHALSFRTAEGLEGAEGFFATGDRLREVLDEVSKLNAKPVSALESNDHFAALGLWRLSRALETFAAAHAGSYPETEEDLLKQRLPFLHASLCSSPSHGFVFQCDFRKEGYKLVATRVRRGKTGSAAFGMKTGGMSYVIEETPEWAAKLTVRADAQPVTAADSPTDREETFEPASWGEKVKIVRDQHDPQRAYIVIELGAIPSKYSADLTISSPRSVCGFGLHMMDVTACGFKPRKSFGNIVIVESTSSEELNKVLHEGGHFEVRYLPEGDPDMPLRTIEGASDPLLRDVVATER